VIVLVFDKPTIEQTNETKEKEKKEEKGKRRKEGGGRLLGRRRPKGKAYIKNIPPLSYITHSDRVSWI